MCSAKSVVLPGEHSGSDLPDTALDDVVAIELEDRCPRIPPYDRDGFIGLQLER